MSCVGFSRCLSLLFAAMCALVLAPARADTPVTLLESFAGNVNFAGTEATLRTSKDTPCTLSSTGVLTKTLSGIPTGSTINKVYLYWAGSGTTTDFDVSLKAPGGSTTPVTAARKYTGLYTQGTTTYSYFSGVADVTSIVTAVSGATGNGSYTFSGLTVDNGSPYCGVQGVLGGFAVLVVYTNKTVEPYRVLNLYEGFRFTHGDSFTLSLSNFRVPSPIGSRTARIAHITWEGDSSLSGSGEQLKFNSQLMSDSMNPSDNQFNSASNIDGDSQSWGIDFDAYSVGSPTLNGGDTSATTTYGSGQDLVWLSAEIVAVPNTPVNDVKVTLARSGTPALNATITYTATVSTNGPEAEPGPITFTNQLPDGMTYVSVTPGTGWSCGTPSGQSVTCTYAASVSAGTTLPVITIKGKVTTMNTSFVNAASVVGTLFDNVPDNNNATDLWSNFSGTSFLFTDKRCTPDVAIGAAGSNCLPYNGPYVAGTTRPLYITYQNNGVAKAYSTNKNGATVNMNFSLTCWDPKNDAGVKATFAGVTLPLCTSQAVPTTGGAGWSSAVTVYYTQNEASGLLSDGPPVFVYNDVGQVQLNLYANVNNLGSKTNLSRFVSIPALVHFSAMANAGGGSSDNLHGFAEAGESFLPSIRVETADGSYPKNFGRELTAAHSVLLGKPATAGPLTYSVASTGADGTVNLKATYDDIGSVDLTATITSSATGAAPGTYFGLPVTTETRTVGLFYPSYFKTKVTGGTTCLAHMACPSGTLAAGEKTTITNFTYSGQPFNVAVSAFSAANTDLTAHLSQLPAFPATLSVVNAPGSTGTAFAVNGAAPSYTFGLAGTSPLVANVTLGGTSPTAMPASVAFGLKYLWTSTVPHPSAATMWTAPTSAYLRASAAYTRRDTSATGSSGITISSNRGTAAVSVEEGMQVVNGRLLVDNANGSELIKLPLYLHAQYWTGSGWENNPGDTSTVSYSATFTNCRANLIGTGTAPNNCGGSISLEKANTFNVSLGSLPPNPPTALWVNAPGAGRSGSASVLVNGAPAWLPSTQAQIVFGTYRSKFVYIREVY